jgi:hypothetical protein
MCYRAKIFFRAGHHQPSATAMLSASARKSKLVAEEQEQERLGCCYCGGGGNIPGGSRPWVRMLPPNPRLRKWNSVGGSGGRPFSRR